MNLVRRFAIGASACILAGAALAAPTAGSTTRAHDRAEEKTMVFTSITKSGFDSGPTSFIQHSVDKAGGKVIGYDLLTLRINPETDTITMYATFSFAGGQVFSKLRFEGERAVGKILGGSGTYDGATGTVVADNISDDGKRARVTLTYVVE